MSNDHLPEIERVLFTGEQIHQRIAEVAAEISERYRGKTLKLIGVLKGSVFFLTELARRIEVPVKIDFLAISSFSNKSGSPGVVRIAKDLDDGIEDEDVILVEDIVDSGITLTYLAQLMAQRKPRSVRIATLLDRPERRQRPVEVHYVGFQIPDAFVVGYGLDYSEDYRNLKDVCVLEE